MNAFSFPFILAQEVDYSAEYTASGPEALVINLIALGFAIFMIAAMWKIFAKAGKPGWAAIVPIYNLVVLFQIVGRPLWWIILLFIPIVNFVIAIILAIDLAKSYGKGVGYGLGLIFLSPIFYPMLGFGGSQYQGPAAATA